jgi:hypothetical protein
VADAPDRGELLTALTTEHFTLQGARSQTMSETSSRAALYIGAVSSTLVALGFLGQLSPGGDTFNTFALTVLPTLYLLGVFTFVRLVECAAEDFRYGLAVNRIRGYYKQLAGDQANLFLLSGHDDGQGVFANASVPPDGRSQYFTFASVVAVINSVVGGSVVAIAVGAFVNASLGAAAGAGGWWRSSPSSLYSALPTACLRHALAGSRLCSPRRQTAACRAPSAGSRQLARRWQVAPAPAARAGELLGGTRAATRPDHATLYSAGAPDAASAIWSERVDRAPMGGPGWKNPVRGLFSGAARGRPDRGGMVVVNAVRGDHRGLSTGLDGEMRSVMAQF